MEFQPSHKGVMVCKCLHQLGNLPFPLDKNRVHMNGVCLWKCCNQNWETTVCTAVKNPNPLSCQDLMSVKGCDSSCSQAHYMDGACLICGQDYGLHLGHECKAASNAGSRGSWTTNVPKSSRAQMESKVPLIWANTGARGHRKGTQANRNKPRKGKASRINTVRTQIEMSVRGCDASCSQDHFIDGACLICGQDYGSHLGHQCKAARNAGSRGSWTTNIPKDLMSVKGCDSSCSQAHYMDGACLICGQDYGLHLGHECKAASNAGSRGSWTTNVPKGTQAKRNKPRKGKASRINTVRTQAFHTGLMICCCLHDIGKKPFPLDATYFHSPFCKWACCNQDWSITACTAAAISTQSNSSKEAKFSGSPEWQWRNENGNWIPYSPTDMNKIEEAFKDNMDEVLLISGKAYHINTKALIQTNVDYGTTKKIRRVLKPDTGEDFEWRWFREDGQWIPYSLILQKQIEDVFTRNDQDTCTFEKDGRSYCINTAQLIQTNVSSGATKSIQRIAKGDVPIEMSALPQKCVKEIYQYPSSWGQFDEDSQLIISPIKTSSTEYTQVSQQFYSSCSSAQYSIITIRRIQNIDRFKEYQLYRSELVKTLGITNINEKELFHGTDHQAADGICKNGFDWRRCGKNGTAYGNGTYFAVDSKYSAKGYSAPNSSGECKMFLASVLVGRYSQGSRNVSVPPEGFHSLVDNVSTPKIFVVFERKQAYPEYLISFRKI